MARKLGASCIGGAFALLGLIAIESGILSYMELYFRQWVLDVVVVMVVIAIVVGIYALVASINSNTGKSIAIVVVTLTLIVIGFYGFIMALFAHPNEYVRTIDNKNYVIVETGFTNISYEYYEYKNPFMHGKYNEKLSGYNMF